MRWWDSLASREALRFWFGPGITFWVRGSAVITPRLGTNGPRMLIWGFFISTIALFHGTCTINSLSHLMGRKRYETGDDSRNSFILAPVTLGEGWHNHHRRFPGVTRQGSSGGRSTSPTTA